MSSDNLLQPIIKHGWSSGFWNMLNKENSLWWGTRKWWVQCLLWLGVYNGLIGFILWVIPALENNSEIPNGLVLLQVFIMLQGVFSTVAVMVLAQGLIINEKKFGTAAWVMSSPVSRSAFILSKMVGNGWGIFIILVVIPSLVAYLQVSLRIHSFPNALPFIAGIALVCLHLFFYFTLALLLGTIFNSTIPVMGISIGLLIGFNLFSQLLARSIPWLVRIFPQEILNMSSMVGAGQSLPRTWPITVIVITGLSLLFILLAILRFRREEF